MNAPDISASSAILRWSSPTVKGTELRVRLDRSQTDVEDGCTGSTCLIKDNGLGKNTTTYDTATIPAPPVSLSPGQKYFWHVINWDNTCTAPSATDNFTTDCLISLSPATAPFVPGTSQTITATVTANANLIDHVKFSLPGNSYAHLANNPKNDTTDPYNVVVYGDTPGSATLTANVYYTANGNSRCTTSIPIDIVASQPKTCTVSLSATEVPVTGTVAVTMSGNANSVAGDTVRLWIEKQNGSIISPNNLFPAATESLSTYYYYNFAGSSCNSTTTSCSTVTSVRAPTAGNYILHCDLPTDPGKCTGNPFCIINGGSLACTGWASCSNSDYTVIPLCSEGFDSTNLAYLSAWGAWGACDGVSHARARTRTCTEDCGDVADCSAYFAGNCPAGSSCATTGTFPNLTQTETQTCSGQMTGTFFDASAMAVCPANPQLLADSLKIGGGTVSLSGTTNYGPYTTNIGNPNLGQYSTSGTVLSPGTYDLTVNPGGNYAPTPKFACQGTTLTLTGSAPPCLTQPCETAPTTTHDFGFWRTFSGWWQALGGSVYGGAGIASNIPSTIPAGQQYLILQDANLQDGLAQIRTGTLDLGTNPGASFSVSGWNAASGYLGDNMDYDYFIAKMGSYAKTAWDGASKPVYTPGSNGYEIYSFTGNVTMDWSPAAGEKVIYLIKGNVTISGNITVPTASPTFLAVIASGSITFDTNVTQVDGWLVGNTLSFPSTGASNDVQFVGNGSFVGWNGITLSRNLGGGNNTTPAEKFVYRPDLTINAPVPLMQAKYVWRRL